MTAFEQKFQVNEMILNQMKYEDWPQVRNIYLEGIQTGHATFEQEAPSWCKWDASHMVDGRIVARRKGRVIGWAALTSTSSRCVYSGVAEVTVYVASDYSGQGVGSALLEKLVDESEKLNIWTLQAGIFPENKASVAVHRKAEFEIVGLRKRLGKMNGVWRDVLLLERRSETVGID
ncbi:GNAT family N-acetyltransferase [Halobacillus massiliensis]|uniref:GNAT family N-acetyltransferase n=1 Tax=Halobacillus massiliensis TaxID=1926286 RepID=UPI001FE3F12C|nr:GNAT family N-acetyltransferase [Halobacillus massiliensis]